MKKKLFYAFFTEKKNEIKSKLNLTSAIATLYLGCGLKGSGLLVKWCY